MRSKESDEQRQDLRTNTQLSSNHTILVLIACGAMEQYGN